MTTPLKAYQIRAEIERLEFIVYELDRGSCTDTLVERLSDVGAKLSDLADRTYAASLILPPSEEPLSP